jgi:hypothetical protein
MGEHPVDIVCGSLRVVDGEGRTSILLTSSGGAPMALLRSPDGEFEVTLSATDRAAHLGLAKKGYPRIDLQVDVDGTFLSMSEADRHPSVSIGGAGPGIMLYKDGMHLVEIAADEEGVPRLRLWRRGVLLHSTPVDDK